MFSGLMMHTWIVATIAAVVAGAVGFFVVMRGSTFVAHALPQSAFAGAAGASLLGVSTVLGLGAFALVGAFGIAWMSRRGRRDVVTALALTLLLGVGALFLSWSTQYSSQIYSLLFGEVLGVSSSEIIPTAIIGAVVLIALVVLYRPLLLTSVLGEVAEARAVRVDCLELGFLVVVALATSASVPVVGALLMFTLMVAPPAAARHFTDNPAYAIAISAALAVVTVWAAIALSYENNWPIGFFVGVIGAGFYLVGRLWATWRRRRRRV